MAYDNVAAIAVRGSWLKHTYPGSAPLPERDPPPDNRWQRGTVVDAVYLADDEDTVWAEWYRHLAERAIPPLAQMPRELWTWEVDLKVADLSTPDSLAAIGLPPPRPGHRSWPEFQQVGEGLYEDGWAGLLAPSAARPEGKVLCLFRTSDGMIGAKPVSGPRVVDQPPPPPTGMRT
ncbi:MAG: RES family NAD+ phosphorylase [Actinobacteria bacterium]|nr:RES family NAD+ phosphorylase [Actinomycetota bacterium]